MSQRFFKLFCLALLFLIPGAAKSDTSPAAFDPGEVAIQTGEIRFDGTVVNVDGAEKKIILNVVAFALPSGKKAKLTTIKPKTILLGDDTTIQAFGKDEKMRIEDIPVGTPIMVVANDVSADKDVWARLVIFALPHPEEQSSASESTPEGEKQEFVLGPEELRYEGKITGLLSGTMFSTALATSVDPQGKVTEFSDPLIRNAQTGPETSIYMRSNPGKKLTMSNLKIGARVTLIGKYLPGKILGTREIVVWDDSNIKSRSLGSVAITMPVSVEVRQGDAEQSVKSYVVALKHYNQAMTAALENNDMAGKAFVYGRLATTYASLGQLNKALESYQHSLTIWQQLGNSNSEGTTNLNMAGLFLDQKDYKSARAAVENAIRLYGDANPRGSGMAYSRLADIQVAQDETEAAIDSWQRALAYVRQEPERREEIYILTHLIETHAALKQAERVDDLAKVLTDMLARFDDKAETAAAQYAIGHAYSLLEDNGKARTAYNMAKSLWTELENEESVEMVNKALAALGDAAPEDVIQNLPVITPAN